MREDGRRIDELVAFLADSRAEDVPRETREHATYAILDTVSVALAAGEGTELDPLLGLAQADVGGHQLWGHAQRSSASMAALVNGSLAHLEDFDDCNGPMKGHVSAPIVPAIAALAETKEVSGPEFLHAYLLGVEVAGRIGRLVTAEHNHLGWHTTGTLGTISAAAACGRLLGFDASRQRTVLGLAASMASGVRRNFGTPTKALHAGLAARNGVLAAQLVHAGFEASPDAIEGHEGFLDLFVSKSRPEAIEWPELGQPFEISWNYYKRYPTCAVIQPGIDILVGALAEDHIVPDDVSVIRCGLSAGALNIMRFSDPVDHFEAKFSPEYCIAATLATGSIGLETFRASELQNPHTRQLMSKVEVYEHPDSVAYVANPGESNGRRFTQIDVVHGSHPPFSERAYTARGRVDDPFTRDDFLSKSRACIQPRFGPEEAARLCAGLETIESAARFTIPELSARITTS